MNKTKAAKTSIDRVTGEKRSLQRLTQDITYLRTRIVNLYFVGEPRAQSGEWVLVDAGLPWSAGRIVGVAEELFGRGSRPAAIVLTHGHFDHVGALPELARRWEVPVWVHPLELPYLTGRSSYPPADPGVGGGLMARLAPLYPRHPIDLRGYVRSLPADGTVPPLPGWRALHTPGHSPGHISLFRESDRVLLAGDAFTTVKQESALAVLRQRQQVHGPPAYFTIDWQKSRESVVRLAALKPSLAATGHGLPMSGERLSRELEGLAQKFDRSAVPARGRYVRRPVLTDERGVVAVPPPRGTSYVSLGLKMVLLGVALAAVRRRVHF